MELECLGTCLGTGAETSWNQAHRETMSFIAAGTFAALEVENDESTCNHSDSVTLF